jgi:DNA polymerase-3 subunit epsilon
MELNLERPIIFFDLETTGINVVTDRIVQIAAIKIDADGSQERLDRLINPGMPIPEASIQIHGISDADVENEPTFPEVASELNEFFKDCDLAGYNAIKFDIPFLVEEFYRTDVDFDLFGRHFIDVQNIFHKMEPRTLKAAYRFYCNKELEMAHNALADAEATYEILKAQLDRYENQEFADNDGNISKPVINDMNALNSFSVFNRHVDLVGHIIFNDKQQEVFNFGKHKGKPVEDVFRKEPAYFDWMMKSQFPLSTKKVIKMIKMRV